MRLSAATLVPLAIFCFGVTLLVSRFSAAENKPSTPVSVQQVSSSRSPTCTDLAKVQGPVIVFGFEGKTPYSVEIDAQGEITAKGVRKLQELPPVPLSFGFERNNISPSTVKAVVRLASANDFWRLPNVIGQNSTADAAPRFMTVNLSCASHRVVVRDPHPTTQEVQRFAETYMLLLDLVYDGPAAYKPLQ